MHIRTASRCAEITTFLLFLFRGNMSQNLGNVIIISYIPSLSALIQSRKPGSQATSKPSILLDIQQDEMLRQVKEMKAVQVVDTQVTTLSSTPTTVSGNLPRPIDSPILYATEHPSRESHSTSSIEGSAFPYSTSTP
jgi:hypothetical protein